MSIGMQLLLWHIHVVLLSIYLRVALLVTGLLFVIVEHVTLKQRARVTSHSACGSGIRHPLAGLRPLECPHDMAATSRDAESVPAQEEATVLYDLICHFRNVLLITGVSRIRCARGPHQDGSPRSEDPWGRRVPWDHSGAKGLPGSVRNRALPGSAPTSSARKARAPRLRPQLFCIWAVWAGHNHFCGLFSLDVEFLVFSYCLSELWKYVAHFLLASFVFIEVRCYSFPLSKLMCHFFSSKCLQDFLACRYVRFSLSFSRLARSSPRTCGLMSFELGNPQPSSVSFSLTFSGYWYL